ncbi:hypothetical protein LCGC14_2321400 [marine sediment metagenome]|uniref:Uncharacterized protein n=1 Tax=marine sediment metagenome TaxID=412755 RepID=A0A0F9D588_9ZZZZ
MMMTDISDYFGYGPNKLPAHRDVTTCPCKGCQKTRGVQSGLQAQSEAVKFILYLKFLKWLVKRDSKKQKEKGG